MHEKTIAEEKKIPLKHEITPTCPNSSSEMGDVAVFFPIFLFSAM